MNRRTILSGVSLAVRINARTQRLLILAGLTGSLTGAVGRMEHFFGLSIIVFVLSELPSLPPAVTILSKGIGFHLGISSYFLLSLHFLSKAERSLALPARTGGIHSVTSAHTLGPVECGQRGLSM